MEKINGIIISGKVYEAVRYDGISPCMDCRFFMSVAGSKNPIRPLNFAVIF
nr:MAG TPA: NlpE N-terminal domain [Caudoviricetes sp.]